MISLTGATPQGRTPLHGTTDEYLRLKRTSYRSLHHPPSIQVSDCINRPAMQLHANRRCALQLDQYTPLGL